MKIKSYISVGELLDKISILSIKSKNINNEFVNKELEELILIAKEYQVYDDFYISELLSINKNLWKIENKLRIFEKNKIFDEKFIELARNVYKTNDLRSSIKKEINQKYNSSYQEVKVYI